MRYVVLGAGRQGLATAFDLARRLLPTGARTPERLGFGPARVLALRRRGLRIRRVALR